MVILLADKFGWSSIHPVIVRTRTQCYRMRKDMQLSDEGQQELCVTTNM